MKIQRYKLMCLCCTGEYFQPDDVGEFARWVDVKAGINQAIDEVCIPGQLVYLDDVCVLVKELQKLMKKNPVMTIDEFIDKTGFDHEAVRNIAEYLAREKGYELKRSKSHVLVSCSDNKLSCPYR